MWKRFCVLLAGRQLLYMGVSDEEQVLLFVFSEVPTPSLGSIVVEVETSPLQTDIFDWHSHPVAAAALLVAVTNTSMYVNKGFSTITRATLAH